MIEVNSRLHGFQVDSEEELPEIDGRAYTMFHEASGARLLYLKNDDANKAFSITFKTPPVDDTGVFHILEHSVLCGSDRFPVKEPFVNLLKTSMQTFLNALTFPDKTMYPVASTNEQDLLNLVDVYLDAVLNPAIYHDKTIFQQEGWHLEIDAPNAAVSNTAEVSDANNDRLSLRYNGVVYNEMTGAFADPESVLYHAMLRALFPDSCYAFESGGHPRAIPDLTYESYLDTHVRHYRLDNAYIVLYGNLDIDRMLAFLDERHLSRAQVRSRTAPNPVGSFAPRRAVHEVEYMDTAPENACVGLAYVVGDANDFERTLAVDVLLDALAGGNESPIKRAVLDAGLGGDFAAYMMDAQARPAVLFTLRNAKEGVADKLRQVVESEVKQLVSEGIPRDILEASLSQLSFALRERDRGIADGVYLSMSALSGWLYSEDAATTYLHYEEPLAHMRAGLTTDYFEEVLRSLILESDHMALVDLQARSRTGLSDIQKHLDQLAENLTEADIHTIEQTVTDLRARQEAPDTPEDLATLPHLGVADIGAAPYETPLAVLDNRPISCLYHDLPTRNIDYVNYSFNMGFLTWEDLPYASLLTSLFGSLATAKRSAADVDVLSRQHLGALRFKIDTDVEAEDTSKVACRFTISVAALAEERPFAISIPREVWESTCFDDAQRIRDILIQRRIGMEQSFANEGHTRAAGRVASYLFPSGVLFEQIYGIDFYFFLKDLIDHFDERFEDLIARLDGVRHRLFVREGCTVSFTGDREELDAFWNEAGDLGLPRAQAGESGALVIPAPQVKREAFVVPSDVCFVAKGADVSAFGSYDGKWGVLANVLSLDYLWNEVRVKGGAYGVGFRRTPMGYARYTSFRDPHVDETLSRYDEAGQWLASFSPDTTEMEGYIVSTVASHDAPVKPRVIARRQDSAYFSHYPANWREQLRDQVLATTPEMLRSCVPSLEAIAASDAVCAFGSKALLEGARAGTFDTVVTLLENQ